MKVAVTGKGPSLGDQVDSRFGRCPWFVIVDTSTSQFDSVQNEGLSASGGAGVQSAQLLSGRGVSAVLTGNCGPKAFAVLKTAGIAVHTGAEGTVRDAVAQFSAGALTLAGSPNVDSHSGT